MDERYNDDINSYAKFESYIPTIGAMVMHEDIRIGEVDLMVQKDSIPVTIEQMLEAFKKFGFVVKEFKEDEIIEKSFFGFQWSSI